MADSKWTIETLKEHYDRLLVETDLRYNQRFEAQALAVAAALAAAEKAVSKAEVAAEKRFDGVNEFRGQLEDQQATFARQDVVDARIVPIERQLAEAKGRGLGRTDIWGIIIVVATVAVAVAAIFTKH